MLIISNTVFIRGHCLERGRRERRRKQLPEGLKTTRHWKLTEDALECSLWILRFGRSYVTVVMQTTYDDDDDDDDDDDK